MNKPLIPAGSAIRITLPHVDGKDEREEFLHEVTTVVGDLVHLEPGVDWFQVQDSHPLGGCEIGTQVTHAGTTVEAVTEALGRVLGRYGAGPALWVYGPLQVVSPSTEKSLA